MPDAFSAEATPDSGARWARRVMLAAGVLLLASVCTAFLLPRTIFEETLSSLVLWPFKFAGLVHPAASCYSLLLLLTSGYAEYALVLELLIAVILAGILWRGHALSVLATASRGARLLTASLISVALLILYDFFTSSMTPYPFGYQVIQGLLLAITMGLALMASRRWWRILLIILLACVSLQAINAIWLYLNGTGVFMTPGVGPRAIGTMIDPNGLYPLCMMGAVLLVSLGVEEPRGPRRILIWAVVAIVLLALVLTFSRAGGIGLVAGLIYLALRSRKSRVLKIMVAIGLGLMVLMIFARATPEITGTFGTDRAALGRVHIWRAALRMVSDNWLLGVGYGAYFTSQFQYVDQALRSFNPTNTEAKSLYLNILAEHGILGALALALFVWAIAAACSRRTDGATWEGRTIRGIRAVGVAILAASVVDTPLFSYQRFPDTFLWFCLVGFLLHMEISARPPAAEWRLPVGLRRLSLGMAGLLLIGMLSIYARGVMDARRAERQLDVQLAALRGSASFTPIRKIPRALTDAVVADEDLAFYRHPGYSILAMHRALRVNLRAGRIRQGGSTITQQLAKCLFFSKERTLRRKAGELMAARLLERRLAKDQILETYLNTVDFGLEGVHGIRMAARKCFAKEPSQLTSAECALLAGMIPYAPRDLVTRKRARIALRHTLNQLSYARYDRWSEVDDELQRCGLDQWLTTHLKNRAD